MAVWRVIASGLDAAGSFAARHRNFVAGVGLGSGGAVVFNVAKDAAAQFKSVAERYGDAFLVTQSLQLAASADMLSVVCAGLFSASAVTATGVAALLLRGLLVPSGGTRGQMLEISCTDTVHLRIFEAHRLLAMLQGKPNVFVACSDNVILTFVKERLPHTARNRITAHPQDAIIQAQRWSRNQAPCVLGSTQRGSDSAVVHLWAQECQADKAKRLPALHVKVIQHSLLLLRGDSNLDGSPRLLLGIVYFKGPLLHLVTQNLGWYADHTWMNQLRHSWAGIKDHVFHKGRTLCIRH